MKVNGTAVIQHISSRLNLKTQGIVESGLNQTNRCNEFTKLRLFNQASGR